MSQEAPKRNLKKNVLIIWALCICCIMACYHYARFPTWFQYKPLYNHIAVPQKLFHEHNKIFQIVGTESQSFGNNNLNDEDDDIATLEEMVSTEDEEIAPSHHVRKKCATVEEMGSSATTNTRVPDMFLRNLIHQYFVEYGAERVRSLSGEEFCKRGFVYGRSNENGFGNEMYKILSAAGLALMLNRTLILGEDSSANPGYLGLNKNIHMPFGDYIEYSNQSFTLREAKRLWVIHKCASKYKRPLRMRVDSIQKPSETYSMCDDWTNWSYPIIWFYGAQDAVGLQLFLKNVNSNMKQAALRIIGDSYEPLKRANLYGELMRAYISPNYAINRAINWTLGDGSNPDIALHLRNRNTRSGRAMEATCVCIRRLLSELQLNRTARVVIVSDTPAIIALIKKKLEKFVTVIHFDHQLYLNSIPNNSEVMKTNYFQPPRKRVQDWGPLPRWVALVDFFLASRAKYGVISAGSKRVATTYAQLIASLAAANNLGAHEDFKFYSSFHAVLLSRGLLLQGRWGHAWRTFSGSLSCDNQSTQCALTPLHPHAWFDGEWQTPNKRETRVMRSFGVEFDHAGGVDEQRLTKFCRVRKKPRINVVKLELPTCNKLNLC